MKACVLYIPYIYVLMFCHYHIVHIQSFITPMMSWEWRLFQQIVCFNSNDLIVILLHNYLYENRVTFMYKMMWIFERIFFSGWKILCSYLYITGVLIHWSLGGWRDKNVICMLAYISRIDKLYSNWSSHCIDPYFCSDLHMEHSPGWNEKLTT